MARSLEIELALWTASEELRGVVDVQSIGELLLWLFFLKYLSERARTCVPGTGERLRLPADAHIDWLIKRRHEPGNANRLATALRKLEAENPDQLSGVLMSVRSNSSIAPTQDKALERILEIFSSMELRLDPDEMSDDDGARGLEFVMKCFPLASHSHAGELYTPTEVSHLMARLVSPQPGDSIYDPLCGTGSLLLRCAQLIKECHRSRDYTLFGQEVNESAWRLSKMNALLHGENVHHIECGDTLRQPRFRRRDGTLEKFDVVVANPPFSVSNWGWDEARHDPFGRFTYGVPPRGRADYAFILHMIASMKPRTGRMAVVAPHGVLFRGGAEAEIRRNLINNNLLDAVIGMPPKIFYNTGIPTVILYFRANRTDDCVLFVDASQDVEIGRKRNILRPEHLDRIVETSKERAAVSGYSRLVPREEMAANHFDMSIRRYVRIDDGPDSSFDMATLSEEHQTLSAELAEVRREIEAKLGELLGRQ